MDPKQPVETHRLSSVTFMPGISVTVGGKHNALTFWSREKHHDEVKDESQRVTCEPLKNGDYRISTGNGWFRDVYPWAIAYRTFEPVGKK